MTIAALFPPKSRFGRPRHAARLGVSVAVLCLAAASCSGHPAPAASSPAGKLADRQVVHRRWPGGPVRDADRAGGPADRPGTHDPGPVRGLPGHRPGQGTRPCGLLRRRSRRVGRRHATSISDLNRSDQQFPVDQPGACAGGWWAGRTNRREEKGVGRLSCGAGAAADRTGPTHARGVARRGSAAATA